MAGSKNAVLLISSIFLIGSAAALDFNVNVAPTPEANLYQPNSTVNDYFNATVDVKNPGSIGCDFRIKADIEQGEQSLTRYSRAYSMWPGDIDRAEFLYLPINYTGEVTADLSLNYCDREEDIDSYTFNSTEKILPNTTIESKTLEVNRTNALVSLDIEKALLVPQEYPPYWKVGSIKAEDGKAFIEYEPTLFRKGEKIVYTVIQNGTVEGKTEVVLEDQETWYEELFRTFRSIF